MPGERQAQPERSVIQRYVCEVCHREGEMSDFQDECRPGWTHGRLLKIDTTAAAALEAARTYRWKDQDGDVAEIEPPDDPTADAVALLTLTDKESGCRASIYINPGHAEILIARLRASLNQTRTCS